MKRHVKMQGRGIDPLRDFAFGGCGKRPVERGNENVITNAHPLPAFRAVIIDNIPDAQLLGYFKENSDSAFRNTVDLSGGLLIGTSFSHGDDFFDGSQVPLLDDAGLAVNACGFSDDVVCTIF